MTLPHVILASTSVYRGEQLRRLFTDFDQTRPQAGEAPIAGETPGDRAERLACAKARSVATSRNDALIIGSDQVASIDGELLRKPGDAPTARRQLAASSGRCVEFATAVCVRDTRDQRQEEHAALDSTHVQFRTLDEATIDRYVAAEQPLDCAGSFKCEGLGITLFERVDSSDPTALMGLPLIALTELLHRCGVTLP